MLWEELTQREKDALNAMPNVETTREAWFRNETWCR